MWSQPDHPDSRNRAATVIDTADQASIDLYIQMRLPARSTKFYRSSQQLLGGYIDIYPCIDVTNVHARPPAPDRNRPL